MNSPVRQAGELRPLLPEPGASAGSASAAYTLGTALLGAQPTAVAAVVVAGAVFGGAASWLSAWAATGAAISGYAWVAVPGCSLVGAVLGLVVARGAGRPSATGAAGQLAPSATGTAADGTTLVTAPAGATLAPVFRSFAALLDAVPHVVWRADRSGVILHANQAWLREFRRLRPLRVEDLIELLADDDAGAFIGAWDAAQQGGGDVRLRCRLHKPGEAEQRWTDFEIRAVQSDTGGLDGWIGTFTDVQDALVKIESSQQALFEERRLRERAERLAAMKDEFLATVSHELRSPLNAISGWTEILARERGLADSAAHALAIIRRNARAQAKLIGDLQQLSSMVTGKVAMQPAQMDLGALAHEIVAQHAAAAAAKSVQMTCSPVEPAPVHADAGRVGLAIGNLVANAIQFTSQGGRVEVVVRTARQSALLTVSDTGCGIAADRLPTLFDCLQPLEADPAHGRPARRDGLGLGLAVARGMVELNDGSLQAESAGPGLGSVFTLTLPLSAPMPMPAPLGVDLDTEEPAEPVGELPWTLDLDDGAVLDAVAGIAVVIIEADADARELLRVALASLGARTSAAADVDAGIDLLLTRQPDVLLCDSGLATDELRLLASAVDAVQRERRDAAPEARRGAPFSLAVVATDADSPRDNPPGRIGDALPCGARLRKPVSLRTLAIAIVQSRSATAAALPR